MKILDCTLRDGGYYTNWDFDKKLVQTYIEAFNELPVEYLEIGYRSIPLEGYLGEYFYLPLYVLQQIKLQTNKKLVVIFNEKDIRANDVHELLTPCVGFVDMVRIAIDPKNIQRAIILAKEIKKLGFQVGFNVMYMSAWKEQKDFLEFLPEVKGVADYFYMVDSYGGVYPEDVKEIYNLVKSYVDVPIGFHGHNNLELALINTLTAIECGAEMVDATVMGMGRGAGNLKIELLLTALNAKGKLKFDFNSLSKVVDAFEMLHKKYEWGTNLPYMFSGAHSLPQKEVMDWVGKRYYSFNSIIRALDNQSKGKVDNDQLPFLNLDSGIRQGKVLIVGGGPSVTLHKEAIIAFLAKEPDMIVIHASAKNAMSYKSLENRQIFCLVGNEGHRMEEVFSGALPDTAISVLPPFPRKMGTYIPSNLMNRSFELEKVNFCNRFQDSHTAIALQTALEVGASVVYIIGYDGYDSAEVKTKEHELFIENEFLFSAFKATGINLISLTNTKYEEVSVNSIFSKI